MRTMTRRLLALLLIVTAIPTVLLPTAHAYAAGGHNVPILLRPTDAQGSVLGGSGYYQIAARPGDHLHLFAFVGNRGHVKAPISLIPVDAGSGEFGAISYNLPQQPRKHVGAWIQLANESLVLRPDQGAVVPFTLVIPSRLRPGQYIGGLTAFVPAQSRGVAPGFELTVQNRVVIAVVVTVQGQMQAQLRLTSVSAEIRSAQWYVIVHLKNSGNVLLASRGFLWVYAPGSRHAWIHTPFYVDTAAPHSAVHYPVFWTHRAGGGLYRFAVQLQWSGGSYNADGLNDRIAWSGGGQTLRGYFRLP